MAQTVAFSQYSNPCLIRDSPQTWQPQFVAAMSLAEGTSEIIEGVFPLRFKYTEELTKNGR